MLKAQQNETKQVILLDVQSMVFTFIQISRGILSHSAEEKQNLKCVCGVFMHICVSSPQLFHQYKYEIL